MKSANCRNTKNDKFMFELNKTKSSDSKFYLLFFHSLYYFL